MKKILIVEDDTDLAALVENRLRSNQYQVIWACDGREGYKRAMEEKPELIIMDIMMPNLTGGEAVKLLRSTEETRDIPVLFFTALAAGMTDNPSGLDTIQVEGQFYPAIGKPFEPDKLLSAIASLIG